MEDIWVSSKSSIFWERVYLLMSTLMSPMIACSAIFPLIGSDEEDVKCFPPNTLIDPAIVELKSCSGMGDIGLGKARIPCECLVWAWAESQQRMTYPVSPSLQCFQTDWHMEWWLGKKEPHCRWHLPKQELSVPTCLCFFPSSCVYHSCCPSFSAFIRL